LFRKSAGHFHNYTAKLVQKKFSFKPDVNKSSGYLYIAHIEALMTALKKNPALRVSYMEEAFEVMQSRFEKFDKSAKNVKTLGSRFAIGNDQLARENRKFQNLAITIGAAKRAWVRSVGEPISKAAQSKEREKFTKVQELVQKRISSSATLAKLFPDYASLVFFNPLSLGKVRKYLKSDEAIVFYQNSATFLHSKKKDLTCVAVVRKGTVEVTGYRR
jgi:hypothetical protein